VRALFFAFFVIPGITLWARIPPECCDCLTGRFFFFPGAPDLTSFSFFNEHSFAEWRAGIDAVGSVTVVPFNTCEA